MKVHTWVIIAIAMGLWGCAEKEAAQPATVDEAPAAAPEAAVAVAEIWEDEAFVEHMHEHADKLDELNFALADGDLDAAKAHASWLAEHDTNADIQFLDNVSNFEGGAIYSFVDALDTNALDGARIGIFEEYFGDAPEDAAAARLVRAAIAEMVELGADTVGFTIPELDSLISGRYRALGRTPN